MGKKHSGEIRYKDLVVGSTSSLKELEETFMRLVEKLNLGEKRSYLN